MGHESPNGGVRITTREIFNAVQVLDRKVDKIAITLESYPHVKKTAYDAEKKSEQNERDLNTMRDSLQWATRTVAAAFITAVVSGLLTLVGLAVAYSGVLK